MNRLFLFITLFVALADIHAQNKIPFGEIRYGDLENKPYKPDPGADAIILSDMGIATLNYDGNKFYVELIRDVKIRIVNSNGFDYANIELPFSVNDRLATYRASTFNLRDGEIVETPIPKKSFILDNASRSSRILRFNFPDVHEGSVLEYSYDVILRDYAVNILVPWEFQADIPVISSSLTVAYPEFFIYRSIFSGSALSVNSSRSFKNSSFFRESVRTNIISYYVQDMPAFREEVFIKSKEEHLTKISFELASVEFPGSSMEEINPTYETLSKELLERTDFGGALSKTGFLKKTAADITAGATDEVEKLKKIHEYVSGKILWNGIEDFTASDPLKVIFNEEKGNSADINLLLIAMLRAANIKADPVILSTRSNGTMNQVSAMMRQFNYVLAFVNADDSSYLVDATDPLRPFDALPFNCLNDAGRLISETDSRFVELRDNKKNSTAAIIDLTLDQKGILSGEIKTKYSGINAYDIRKMIMLEGKNGYLDLMKAASTEIEITDFSLENLELRDSDIIETVKINIHNGTQAAGDRLLFNPFLSPVAEKNIFWQETRNFPVDFGSPSKDLIVLKLKLPSGYSLIEKPADFNISVGKNDCIYEFKCLQTGNDVVVRSLLGISRTHYQPSEYSSLRDFYSQVLRKQAELLVLKKADNLSLR